MLLRLGLAERLFLVAAISVISVCVCSAKDVVWCTSGKSENEVCRLAAGQFETAKLDLRLICEDGRNSKSCMARLEKGTAHVSVLARRHDGGLEVPLCGHCKAKEWSFCITDNLKNNRVESLLKDRASGNFSLSGQEVVDDSFGMLVSKRICRDGRLQEGSPLSSFCKSWECVRRGLGVGLATKSAVVRGHPHPSARNCSGIYRSLRLLCEDGLCEQVTQGSLCWKRHLLQGTVLVHTGLSIRHLSQVMIALWPPVTPSAEAVDANLCLLRDLASSRGPRKNSTNAHPLPLASSRRRRLAQATPVPSPPSGNNDGGAAGAAPSQSVNDGVTRSPQGSVPIPRADSPTGSTLPDPNTTPAPKSTQPDNSPQVPPSDPLADPPPDPVAEAPNVNPPPAPIIGTPPPDPSSPPVFSPDPPNTTPPDVIPPVAPVPQPTPFPPPVLPPATSPTFEPSPPQAPPPSVQPDSPPDAPTPDVGFSPPFVPSTPPPASGPSPDGPSAPAGLPVPPPRRPPRRPAATAPAPSEGPGQGSAPPTSPADSPSIPTPPGTPRSPPPDPPAPSPADLLPPSVLPPRSPITPSPARAPARPPPPIVIIPPVDAPAPAPSFPSPPPPADPPPPPPLTLAPSPEPPFAPPPPVLLVLAPPPPDSRRCLPPCPKSRPLKPLPDVESGIKAPETSSNNCICTFPMQVFIKLPMGSDEFGAQQDEFLSALNTTLMVWPDKIQLQGLVVVNQQFNMLRSLLDVAATDVVEVETWILPMGSPGDQINKTKVTRIRDVLYSDGFVVPGFDGAQVSLVLRPGENPPPPPPSLVPVGANPSGRPNNPPTNKVDNRPESRSGISSKKLTVILSVAGVCALLFVVVAALFAIRYRRQRQKRMLMLLQQQQQHGRSLARKSHTSASSRGSRPSRGSQQGYGTGPFAQKAPSVSAFSISSLDSAKTGQGARAFTFDELERATNGFADANVLGQGGFGMVFRGRLDNGWHVAVKILKGEPDIQTDKEFVSEIEVLGRLHHRNLVRLLGMCSDGNARCLIYELVSNGSLEAHLHGPEHRHSPLDWESRVKIALGASRGLCYLHEGASPRIIHRDFKASNILLEKDFNAKVSDFGLAKQAVDGRTHVSTRVMGTFGYVAPEYAMTGHLLVKSDVYSFGVVLLELLTGRKPVDLSQRPGQENLVTWARPLLLSESGLSELMDPCLPDYPRDNAQRLAELAAKCVHPEVIHRPVMSEVVQELEQVYHDLGLSDTTSLVGAPLALGEYNGYTSIPPSQDLQHFPIPPAPGSARSSGPQQFRAGSSIASGEQSDTQLAESAGYTPRSLLPGNKSSAPLSSSTPKSGPLRTLRQWGERAMDGINGVLRSNNPPAAPVTRPAPVSRAGYGLGSSRREENSGELEYDPRWR